MKHNSGNCYWDYRRPDPAKVSGCAADIHPMINPISSGNSSNAEQVARQTASKNTPKAESQPQSQTQKSGSLSKDQVTLKSAGQPEQNGKKH